MDKVYKSTFSGICTTGGQICFIFGIVMMLPFTLSQNYPAAGISLILGILLWIVMGVAGEMLKINYEKANLLYEINENLKDRHASENINEESLEK